MGGDTATNTIVIGAGQAGLAMSYWLKQHGIEHVVLERGTIGNSWRTQRWDSFRLNTPNTINNLPGDRYDGDEPWAFDTHASLVEYFAGYTARHRLPVEENVEVTSVRGAGDGFEVVANGETRRCRNVVLCSGDQNLAQTPALAAQLPDDQHRVRSRLPLPRPGAARRARPPPARQRRVRDPGPLLRGPDVAAPAHLRAGRRRRCRRRARRRADQAAQRSVGPIQSHNLSRAPAHLAGKARRGGTPGRGERKARLLLQGRRVLLPVQDRQHLAGPDSHHNSVGQRDQGRLGERVTLEADARRMHSITGASRGGLDETRYGIGLVVNFGRSD